MASPVDADINTRRNLPAGIATSPGAPNFIPLSIQRAARDRSVDEKNRQAEEKENEYWRSIVPSSSTLGLAELHLDEVFDQIQRRVRREVKYLCLLPLEDFNEPNSSGTSSEPKRYLEWLRCAATLVSASLNLDSPNPIGWDAHEDSFVLSRLQNGEVAPSYWILGAYCLVRGAQPWQATRSYIAAKVYELLEAEGWAHWIKSEARWDALFKETTKPIITKHLQDLNKAFNLSDNSSLLELYAQKIWSKFVDDHLKALPAQSAALAPLYTLTENYVKLVGTKLEICGELQGSLVLSPQRKSTDMTVSKLKLESSVMKRVKKLQYEYFPLIRGGELAVEKVRDKVLERLHAMFHVVQIEDASSSKVVASILNDLEDQHGYLSTLNCLSQVRVCISDIADHSIASVDGSSFLVSSRSSANESDSKKKRMRESSNNKATHCGSASWDSSIGHSEKRSKGSKTVSTNGIHQNESTTSYAPLTLAELRETVCGNCLLCAMPDCDRCFSCVENSLKENKKDLKCCIRRMCCKVPTQLKSQPAVELGLPTNWRFSFDDPERCNLITFNTMIAPVGLKIISPIGKQFYSLQSAFTHIPHSNAQSAIQLVEAALKGFGSSHYVSCPTHFLVGKDYCIDYMNGSGSRVTLFGKIVACMKSNSAPDPEVATDETTFFILQFRQDTSNPKNAGTNVPPFHLIPAVTAWGGCIAFERKTTCRPHAKGVIARIDQATPVETWVTPDMQWEEMVPQPNGTKLPMLSLIVRGYKFVLRAKESQQHDGRTQYGLFASCTSLKSGSNMDEELNFRPGEMVDLGVCSPLRESDSKELSVFIAKNYIHSLKCGRWGFLGIDDNIMHDITDDASGDLHELAATRSLSYIRKWNQDDKSPTIHARLDPHGHVHCLLGVPYQGNWSKYESDMKQFAPLFSGQVIELTILHNHIQGNNKRSAETKHLQVIRMFQLEDIVPCFNFLISLIPNATAAKALDPKVRRRALRVIHCIEIRTQELLDASREVPQDDVHSSLISSTFLKVQAMKHMLEENQEIVEVD